MTDRPKSDDSNGPGSVPPVSDDFPVEIGASPSTAKTERIPGVERTLFMVVAQAPVYETPTGASEPRPTLGDDLSLVESAPPEPDYGTRFLSEIGRGGFGKILVGEDLGIGRYVAVKVPLDHQITDPAATSRLLRESQVTGQLEHPNIVPIYQLGRLKNGQVYFTMKRVMGQTLKDILYQLQRGDAATTAEYTRLKLLSIFMQICLAVDYAHSKGVIHRDLKPENIMLGGFGEVYVMDWGLARLLPTSSGRDGGIRIDDSFRQERQGIAGTPAYMAPEQARGHVEKIDALTDVYSLGSILYEMLTYVPPVKATDLFEALEEVLSGNLEAPSKRAPSRQIPPPLDTICLRAMAFDKENRYPSARALYGEVQSFFEGSVLNEQRRKDARQRVAEGDATRQTLRQVTTSVQETRNQLKALISTEGGKRNDKARGEIWDTEDRLARMELEQAHLFSSCLNAYLLAVSLDPDSLEARRRLADLYWAKYLEAERERDQPAMATWEDQLRRVNDGGYDEHLRGEGKLTVTVDPPHARLALLGYNEQGRIMTPEFLEDLGEGRVSDLALRRGSYLLEITCEGYADSHVPVFIERMRTTSVHVPLLRPETLGEGFVHIPGGPVKLGGDPETFGSWEERELTIPRFAMGRFPVTLSEYLEFLNDRSHHRLEEASRHAPREYGVNRIYLVTQGDLFALPDKDREGDAWLPEWPVLGISYDDALAYVEWRSRREGVRYRLPTDEEWEKAARGVDMRRYPWGNRFDPTFCNMRQSFEDRPRLAPVDSFPIDESPYGVRGMAGNIRTWVQGQKVDAATENLTVRGGAWTMYENFCRCASRTGAPRSMTAVNIGLRLAKDV